MSGLFGGGQKATTHATRAMGIDFQGAQYGNVVPVVYGKNKVPGNCIWYGDFQSHAQQQKSGKGGGGGGTTNYTYSASAQMGLCEGPGVTLVTVYDGTSVVNLSSLNYAFAAGNLGQAAWSHLSGNAALGYSLTAVFSFQNLDLGSQATLPNYNYEVKALKPYSASIPDANPKDIVSDICSDPYHGINFPYLGDLTQYSNYCVANSLFLSPVYDQQQTAQQTLSDLFNYTNTYVYYSEDQLKVVPLGDVAVTGNGVTFTPNVTPLVDLDDSNFLVNGPDDPPITVDRIAPQDALNLVRVEFKDRSNTYHDSAVVAAIDFDVIANGERSDTSETVNGCTSAAVARFIAQNLVQRAFYVRNTYQFKLPWNYCYLEPTDIVTLTDTSLGLNRAPVRITSVEEDGGSVLTIEAEEFPEGIGHSAIYGTQSNGGTNVDQNADPGAVNAPYLFRGPGFLVSNNTPEIWCACNGSGALWAACEVYLSHDGASYTYCGTIASQARYGALTTSLPAGSADPDTTNTPSVQLYAPAQLLGGSQTDADNFVTLAMVDTEIIAYETATLTGTETYQLGYLRRGGYGSANVLHNAGAPFVRLDDSIFRIPVDPSLIGQTVYLKFLSMNAFGRGPRTLADETAYTYVVGTNVELPDVPDVPAGFAVSGVADGVSITWTNDNPAAVGCTSIEYATAAAGPWTVLAQVGPTTTGYHHGFTDGATYYYRARARGPLPQSGWSAYTDTFNSTGVDVSQIAANASNALLTANEALGNTPYLQNPYFTTGDLTGWSSDYGGWVFQSGTNGPATGSTTYAKRTGSSTHPSEALRNSGKIPVYPGAVLKAQCAVKGYNSPNGTCGVRISWRDASDTELSTTAGNTTTGNATNGTYVTGTAPANAMFAHVECAAYNHTTGYYTVDNFAAWALSDSVDQVPDGTTYARTSAGALTGGNVDLAKAGVVNKNLGNVADGGGRYGVHAVDSNNLALVDFSQAGHVNKNLDNIGDGGVRLATVQGLANSGSVLVDNANFMNGLAGWVILSGTAYTQSASPLPATGAQYIVVASGTGAAGSIITARKYGCKATDVVSFGGLAYAASGVAQIGVAFYTSTGAFISQGSSSTSTAAWSDISTNVAVPSNAAYFVITCQQLTPGPCYACFNYVWASTNDVRIPGSGQTIGDQRNLLPVTWAGVRSVLSTSPISFSISGTTVNFTVAAVTVNAGGVNVSYNPSSGSVTQAAGTTVNYMLYYRDATSSGGSKSLNITTSVQALAAFPDIVLLGSASVTVASGGGGTGGTGGGGGGYCVADDMFIAPGKRAGDADTGDPFDCIDLPTAAGKHQRALQGVSRGIEECVRMITNNGCALVCSISTPFDLPDGRSTTAPHMLGEEVITDLGTATVTSLALVGPKPVTRAHLGGVSYAAGADATRRIYSHNVNGIEKP